MTAKRDEYRKKRDRVAEELSKCYELTPSEGSFYAFPAYPRGFDEESFIGACLERKLLVVPGSSFSRQATHFRLSFAVSDEMLDRGIARHGYDVSHGTERVGRVTSGTRTPFLEKAIGMAYVPTDLSAPDTELGIDVRGRLRRARVVPMPFYKRARS